MKNKALTISEILIAITIVILGAILLPPLFAKKATSTEIAQSKMTINLAKGQLAGGFDMNTNPLALDVLRAAAGQQSQIQAHGENGAQIVEKTQGNPKITGEDLIAHGWIPAFPEPDKGHWLYYSTNGYTTNLETATVPARGQFLKAEYYKKEGKP